MCQPGSAHLAALPKFFLAMLVSGNSSACHFCLFCLSVCPSPLPGSPKLPSLLSKRVSLAPVPSGSALPFFLSHLRGLHICTGWVSSWLLLRCITDTATSAALQRGRRKHAGMYPFISKGFSVSGKQTSKNASLLEEWSQERAGSTAPLLL